MVWEELQKRKEAASSEYIFPSPKDKYAPISDNKTAWQLCKRKAKVTGRFHDLRHTFLTIEVARKKHQAIDVCIYAGLSLEELQRTYLHPTFQDTSYIADKQDEKLASMFSNSGSLDQILDHKIGSTQYA